MVKIYGLICPMSGEIRYIGKTEEELSRRLRNHLAEARNKLVSHKQRWLRKCLNLGVAPTMWLLEEVQQGESWQDRERAWIAKAVALGFKITNQTAGGEGVVMNDPEAVARWKANLAVAMDKVRETPEFKENKSKGAKRAWVTHRDALMTAFARPETKAKHSKRAKRCWSDPDTRDRMMNRWTPEAKAKQAAELETRRQKMLAARTPEVRAKQAATLKATWAKRKAAKA